MPPKFVNAALNARDASGAPPLFMAVRCGAKGCVRELVKLGADVTIVDNNLGSTFLDTAHFPSFSSSGHSIAYLGLLAAYHAPFDAPFIHKGHASALKELTCMEFRTPFAF